MDAIIEFLGQWGYVGCFVGAFIAGSAIPMSSEALLVAFIGTLHLDPVWCLIAATAGNVCGGMTCYWIGSLGKQEWIEKYLHVKPEKIERAKRFLKGRGAWMAFFAFIPLLGTALTIVLGYMRANVWIVLGSMTLGKAIRYAIVIWGTLGIISIM